MSRCLIVVCTCVLLLIAATTVAADCPELVGRLPYGAVSTVAVSGDYAYFNSGDTLKVADVSDPSAPHVVGYVVLPGSAQDVAVSGSHAYVAALYAGLRVIDVSNPAAPVEVGFVDTPGRANGVAVAGGYAYVVGESGLRVIDVSTPSAPVEVGFLDTPGVFWDVAVSGGYAYVAAWGDGLRVIDVSTPSAPVEVGFVDTPGAAWGVAVSGDYAHVVWGDSNFPNSPEGGLAVVDVSTPSAPVVVGFVDTLGVAFGVAVADRHAYVAWRDGVSEEGGLRVIDVSTPAAPFEVGFVDTLPSAENVAVSGSNAYVAAGGAGLRVIDVSTPSAPFEVGVLDAAGPSAVAVSGSYAYVAWGGWEPWEGGLRVIDVSVPSTPVEVAFIDTPRQAHGVAVSGSYAYVAWGWVATQEGGLRVIDVSTPSAPVEVGSIDTPDQANGVAVDGGYAYVAYVVNNPYHGGLRVIDVSTPSAPVEVGSIDTPVQANGVAVDGGYAYVVTGDPFWGLGSLRVIDVSVPSAPVEVGFVDTPGDAHGVAVAGGYAYVVGEGLTVIDVSAPSVPVKVGWLRLRLPNDVEVSDGHAYVADGGAGLFVIDVRAPSAPVEVGVSETPDGADGVSVSDGHVFLAGGAGLYVFRECDPLGDLHESFIPAAAVAAGAQGAFFQTDVEINNKGTEEAQVSFQWLPRDEDNSEPIQSEPIALAPGQSMRYENVLAELFGLGPDSLGALKVASTEFVIGMSRTYNSPQGKGAGTFGQGLPAIRAAEMIKRTEPQRILFLSEDPDSRANVGCVNGSIEPVRINVELFDDEGTFLETKTMDLGPYSNNQINQVFGGYGPVSGYVDVWADDLDALYTCYGSVLDNETSDPTTILPQVPCEVPYGPYGSFIPAAAFAAGLQGSFFRTDVELNNVGSSHIDYALLWLPRGEDNSDPVRSGFFALSPGAGVRYSNVLGSVFGLEPDQVGALQLETNGPGLLAMSRTYNLPSAKVAGTFGQELPGIAQDRMIPAGVKKRIIFMNENDDVRSNVGCQNGSEQAVRVFIELFNAEGESLETKTMDLAPYSNNQINRVFRDYSPVSAGYVDVWTNTEGASIYCYGSMLDNLTSDPTTVLPQ